MEMQHEIELVVPYSDCDPSGFVHHARVVEWLERARVGVLGANGMSIVRAQSIGYGIVTARVDVAFVKAISPGDHVTIETDIYNLGVYAIKTRHAVYVRPTEAWVADIEGNEHCIPILSARAEITSAFVGLDDHRPKILPEAAWSGDWKPDVPAEEQLDAIANGDSDVIECEISELKEENEQLATLLRAANAIIAGADTGSQL